MASVDNDDAQSARSSTPIIYFLAKKVDKHAIIHYGKYAKTAKESLKKVNRIHLLVN